MKIFGILFVLIGPGSLQKREKPKPSQVVAELLNKCPEFERKNTYTPSCPFGNVFSNGTTEFPCDKMIIYTRFSPARFIEMDDTLESFQQTATLATIWHANCPTFDPLLRFNIKITDSEFWTPDIEHVNSVGQHDLQSLSTRFLLSVTATGQLVFAWYHIGIFHSYCDLHLQEFPFDEQICTFLFASFDSKNAVELLGTCVINHANQYDPQNYIMRLENFISPDSMWQVVSGWCEPGYELVGSTNRSVAKFFIKFKRNPVDFVFSLLLPSFILTLLGLFNLLSQPNSADRPNFSLTVLLALTFVNSAVSSTIPSRPYRVLLSWYIDSCSFFTGFCTFYCLLTLWLSHCKTRSKLLKFFKLQIRVIDLLFFSSSVVFLLAINIRTLFVANGLAE